MADRESRLTPEEKAEVVAFVKDLYERSGARSWAAFGRHAGVSEYSLTEWRSGRGTPSAINLIRMIRAVGLGDQSIDRLGELRATVERQGKATTRALKAVEAEVSALRDRLEPPAQEANGA